MTDTINELYEKYADQVGALEDDRYFQYLFEMIQAGDNTLQQKNRVLHKVVDERWLKVVEEGIHAIFNIVDNPRRFITTSEEVVPVALAKKITEDSVRHLSQNTQFIATNAAGEIQPTRILDVTTEESYDLYENRFVYHLIQRLFTFVDKRTDVIFWNTGDETCNVMSMESKVDDAYEEISYKVEMTIKNRQSLVENDADNMDIFKRIDRVRRMSRTLRSSSFCDIMNGCAKVRSPIQRTNLMMKDPDYRTCYKLWQFIESYDEVGYTIEERDSALQFDEEYLLQMYINMITNYTVFKSLLESDPRKMTEIETKKRKPVQPKFVKEIEEEIVDDPNIPDVEIRKVFVEEVTQAQLDAEAKLAEETEKREQLESSVKDLQSRLQFISDQMAQVEEIRVQLEAKMRTMQDRLEAEKKARRSAEDAMAAADIEARKSIELAQQQAKEEVEAARKEAEETVAAARKEAEETVAAVKKEADESVSAAKKEAEETVAAAKKASEKAIEEEQKKSAETIATAQKEAEAAVQMAQKEAKEQIETVRKETAQKVKKLQQDLDSAKQEMKDNLKQRDTEWKDKLQKAEEQAQKNLKREVQKVRNEAETTVKKAKAEANATVQKIQTETEKTVKEAQKKLQAAENARERAEAKAEANSLSRYIRTALEERKERKKTKGDNDRQ